MTRTLVWFSAGAASAVAAKIALAERNDVVLAYADPGSEHPDNERFIVECERWFGREVLRLRSPEYVDTWDVWARRRFILGAHGAPCTVELKKKVRRSIELPADEQVFGYTAEERHRADRFRDSEPGVTLWCPLIDHGLTKADCLSLVDRAGIELPAMYRLGYQNNNCIGCPKGGMGYWNMIRRDFPSTFDRMAALEREFGHAINKDADGPVFLDELDPDRGDIHTEPDIECSLLCPITEEVWT